MSTSAFDDARGDGQSFGEVVVVSEVGGIGEQVVNTVIDGLTVAGREATECRTSPYARSDVAGVSAEDFEETVTHPGFELRTSFRIEGEPGRPEVLGDMDHIDDQVELDSSLASQLAEDAHLRFVAVDQRDPGLLVERISVLGLLKCLCNDLFRCLLETRPDTFPLGQWAFLVGTVNGSQSPQDILRLPHEWIDG